MGCKNKSEISYSLQRYKKNIIFIGQMRLMPVFFNFSETILLFADIFYMIALNLQYNIII